MNKVYVTSDCYFYKDKNKTTIVTPKTKLTVDCGFDKFLNIYKNLKNINGFYDYSQFKPDGTVKKKYL